MTPDIRELDPETVDRIAAGEVVERPASVVKELVENAIDADASRIEIAVDGDGTERISVSDDGVGLSASALRTAVRQHTTSKLDDADDLAHVTTLGFRGEALHTIGAVSRMTITSRPRNADDDRGTRLELDGGEVTTVEPAGRPAGTTVTVRDLFHNTPARRKYLGTETTEFGHVNRVASQYALANPDVAIELTHDDRTVFATDGQGDLRSAVLAVYGRDVARGMIPVDARAGDAATDDDGGDGEADRTALPTGPLDRVHGLVSDPETTRSTRDYCSTFVNGRYVTDADLRNAIIEGYGASIAPDRYPFAVLFLEVPPDATDVNVHPRKLDVRFDDAAGARTQVERAVRDALTASDRVRSSAARGQSAPPATTLDETAGAAEAGEPQRPTAEGNATPHSDTATEASADRPSPPADGGTAAADTAGSSRSDGDASTDQPDTGSEATAMSTATDDAGQTGAGGRAVAEEPTAPSPDGQGAESRAATDHGSPDAASAGRFDTTTQSRFGGEPTLDTDRLPAMDVLGQVDDTYVVAASDDGLLLVDQHAADERVAYERLRDAAADGASQSLVDPVTVELTAAEAAAFDDVRTALERIGFEVERSAERRVTVRAVPSVIDATLPPERLRDAIGAALGGGETAGPVRDAADALLADLACDPAVTAGVSLSEGSIRDLLDALDGCDDPTTCPHGRPTIIRIDEQELAARFERDYPGHERRPE